jgi:hypothetical protein
MVYVTERSRVLVFTTDGRMAGLFADPDGVSLGGLDVDERFVYVAEPVVGLVKRFRRTGEVVAAWGSSNGTEQRLQSPADVAVASGFAYVVDRARGRLFKYTVDGAFVTSWPVLREPTGVGVAPDGDIWVVNQGSFALQRFRPDGTLLASHTYVHGRFLPNDIAVARSGEIYVSSTHEIFRFRELPPPTATVARGVPAGGRVLVRRPGESRPTPMQPGEPLPTHTVVDVRNGTLELSVLVEGDGTSQGTFWGGRFAIGAAYTIQIRSLQSASAVVRVTRLPLRPKLTCPKRGTAAADAVIRRGLNIRAPRHFRVVGRYASVRPLGSGRAQISVRDTCKATTIIVRTGRVEVFDLVRKRGRAVTARRTVVVRPRA